MDGAGPAGSLAGRPPSQGTPGLLHCWGRFWKRLSDLLTRARGGQKAPPSRRQQGDRSGQARAEAMPPASGSCPRRLSASRSGLRCWPRGEPGPVPRFPRWPHLRPHVLGLGLPGTLSVGPVPRDAVALGVAPACPGPSTRFPGVQSWPASQPPFGTGPLGFAARQVQGDGPPRPSRASVRPVAHWRPPVLWPVPLQTPRPAVQSLFKPHPSVGCPPAIRWSRAGGQGGECGRSWGPVQACGMASMSGEWLCERWGDHAAPCGVCDHGRRSVLRARARHLPPRLPALPTGPSVTAGRPSRCQGYPQST